MATPVDRDPTPCPLAVLTAMTKHNVDGKRMLALAQFQRDAAPSCEKKRPARVEER